MRTTTRRLAASLLFALLACPAARADVIPSIYRYLLVDADDNATLAAAVAGLSWNRSARDRGNCDLIAEHLWLIKARKLDWNGAGIWILRVLPYCPDPSRYSAIVEEASKALDGQEVRGYTQKYRSIIGRDAAERYVPGSIDLDALRAAQRRASFVEPKPEQAKALVELPSNITIDELFARAGPPTHIASHGVKTSNTYAVDLRQLWFFYRGIGRVTFANQRETGWQWHDMELNPIAFEEWMPYRAYAAELGQPDDSQLAMMQLLSGNSYAMTVSAQHEYRAKAPSAEYLDTAAELLLRHYAQVAGPVDSEAYSWLCNVLSDRGGPRYANVLGTVARKAPDEKLKRFAKQRVATIGVVERTPYVPGSIDLEAQSKKYPVLYARPGAP